MELERIKEIVIEALEDIKGFQIKSINVRVKSSFTDIMIIVSGNTARQVKAIGNNLIEVARKQNITVLGSEGEQQGEWMLVDLGDIVVHIMQPDIRDFYNLEKLWGDDSPNIVSNDVSL
ncbi:MAG: ribosome silencing factor [Gammaproteobacteria bacterium]